MTDLKSEGKEIPLFPSPPIDLLCALLLHFHSLFSALFPPKRGYERKLMMKDRKDEDKERTLPKRNVTYLNDLSSDRSRNPSDCHLQEETCFDSWSRLRDVRIETMIVIAKDTDDGSDDEVLAGSRVDYLQSWTAVRAK